MKFFLQYQYLFFIMGMGWVYDEETILIGDSKKVSFLAWIDKIFEFKSTTERNSSFLGTPYFFSSLSEISLSDNNYFGFILKSLGVLICLGYFDVVLKR